ncbi:MAG: DNA topoisomerase IV subunit A [Victivallales bacterium]|nr:DNA topoisomerase IV subunit A [Victivallales bacterium]
MNSEDENIPLAATPLPATYEQDDDQLRKMVANYYIEYASYVIQDRAIPDVDDGLKPVQRRILHCLHAIDDGRFNRVASAIGDTMHYHPHGDQSIGDALVVLANTEYFIEKQGNFGNIFTGDSAAAPRYIECRLSQLARDTMFSKEITEYVPSYDGRSQEPVCLPAKIPALLMLGSDGIAVGMTTTIFPHNFNELLDAEIALLKGEQPEPLYPDFLQGGIMDASEYDDGRGRIRVRARIEPDGDKKVIIREIPPTTTTEKLLVSIEDAAKKGKLKIASIADYTTDKVSIEITLARGVYAEETIRELYAYTNCEVSINSVLRVIKNDVPVEMSVSEVLARNVEKLKEYLTKELEIEREKQEKLFHEKTLAQIFIENRIYKRIEKCETVEAIFKETRKGLEAHVDKLRRPITDDDIDKLLQIPIRRISLFDIRKNEQELAKILEEMDAINDNLAHIDRYAIAYLTGIKEKYGSLYPRHTEVAQLEAVKARDIARRDVKVYHDKVNNFLGTNVKASAKDAAPVICTEFDKLVLLRNDGSCRVIQVPEKEYIGPTKYVMVADRSQIYSIIYQDKTSGTWYAKRFRIGQFMLNKEYHIIPEDCVIRELYTNDGVVIEFQLVANRRRSCSTVKVDFKDIALRSRDARGFRVTVYQVEKINVLDKGRKADPNAPEEEEAADVPEQSSAETPSTEQPPQTEDAPPAEQQPEKPKLKKRIDEDSPFFLE